MKLHVRILKARNNQGIKYFNIILEYRTDGKAVFTEKMGLDYPKREVANQALREALVHI